MGRGDFVDIAVPGWAWPALIGGIAALLLVDLLVVHRKAHEIGLREAAVESVAWVALGLGFAGGMWAWFSRDAAVEYLSGYLIEKSLSIDNVFVWLVIFAHFKVPRAVDFVAELPRLPTGKLYKRLLRDAYWGKKDSKIV